MGVRTLVPTQVDEAMWQTSPEPTTRSSWQGMLQAAVAAVLVVGLLAGGVVLAWNTGSGPASSATLAPEVPPTPTPRVLAFNAHTPAPDATTTTNVPEPAMEPEAPAADAGGLVIVATPETIALNVGAGSRGGAGEKVLFAATTSDFKKLAGASWEATSDGLENSGDQAIAAKWLTLAKAPGPGFVVEAEMRVTSTLGSVCDQSFGITGGSQKGKQVFGAGVIFPCDGDAQARITDALDWEDGYNADVVLDESSFTPGEDWRHYRFELDGTTLRLSIDGEQVAETNLEPGINPDAADLEVGLWSQGVGVQVREITVTSPS
jgi:hypothetical protein